MNMSFRAPPGFVVIGGDLCSLDREDLADASSATIDALYGSEDLCAVEHLVLDAGVHLDALMDVFCISVFIGNTGNKAVERWESTFGAAVQCFENVARDIWSLDLPWRNAATAYDPAAPSNGPSGVTTWIVPGGWTVLLDELSRCAEPLASAAAEPMRALFAATSSHRSIAVYGFNCAGTHPPYAGLLWADPVGKLYERVLFQDVGEIAPWLRARLRQGDLPRRKKRG